MHEDDAPQEWGSPDDPPVSVGLRILYVVTERMEWVGRPGKERCLACGSGRVRGHAWQCPMGRAMSSTEPTRDALLGIVWDAQVVAAMARRGLMIPLTDFIRGFDGLEKKVTRVLDLMPRN